MSLKIIGHNIGLYRWSQNLLRKKHRIVLFLQYNFLSNFLNILLYGHERNSLLNSKIDLTSFYPLLLDYPHCILLLYVCYILQIWFQGFLDLSYINNKVLPLIHSISSPPDNFNHCWSKGYFFSLLFQQRL